MNPSVPIYSSTLFMVTPDPTNTGTLTDFFISKDIINNFYVNFLLVKINKNVDQVYFIN